MHARVFRLAVRLLRGEELHLVDEHGRRWTATTKSLAYHDAPVVEGSAYDVAAAVVARRLTERRSRRDGSRTRRSR